MKKQYHVFVIKSDGSVERFEQQRQPDYDQIRKAVGGLIETVPHFIKYKGFKRGVAFCNEEGLLKKLPRNDKATAAWLANLGDGPFRYDPVLVGDVIYYAKS